MRKKKSKSILASDLMKQLESDQEYDDMIAEKEKVRKNSCKKIAKDEIDLVREIKSCGYKIDSVWDSVNNNPHPVLERKFTGEYTQAYLVLIKHLRIEHMAEIREGIIRALTVKNGGRSVENALLEEFNIEKNKNIKWVLSNALKTAMPYHRRRKIPKIAEAYKSGENTDFSNITQ